MAEPDRQQIGDGPDNYGQAAGQLARAAGRAGKEAAAKGAEAAANAAAATVKAGVESGKAVAEIAAGTAAGGPLGAVLSAAWAARHTLFKVLVCLCLALLLLIVMVVSLPDIVTNSVFGLDGTKPAEGATLQDTYSELAEAISDVVDEGYDASLEQVEQIIADGGYDYELSMEALVNHAQSSAGFDVSYILAAYSASLQQQGVGKDDMVSKLERVSGDMFPVTYEEKEQERIVPLAYPTYRQATVTVVTGRTRTGAINGVPQYRYDTADRTYYVQDGSEVTETETTVPAYTAVTVEVPVYANGTVTGTRQADYYEADGEETLTPGTETVKYAECTIHSFDDAVIAAAFDIDMDAIYPQFAVTYGEAIRSMADALKQTLYGSLGSGQAVPLTDAELVAFVDRQDCSDMRKHILRAALSLVGKVPYFWGGKSVPGWNEEWNTPKLVTAAGSPSTGTIRPYGLDCSGFSAWVFSTAARTDIGGGCNSQYPNTYAIPASELLPGDLGFLADDDGGWGHVLIFAGYNEAGERMWVHSSSGRGVVLNAPGYEGNLSYRRLSVVDYDAAVTGTY